MRSVPRDTWLEARKALLAEEKALKLASDRLAEARRALPCMAITRDYRFHGAEGEVGLAELFGPHSQLATYHFMYPQNWEVGCKSCSFWADNFEGLVPHLAARDTALVLTSAAPFAQLSAFQARMGWTTPWYSEGDLSFGTDMGVRFTEAERESGRPVYNFGSSGFPVGEAPGLSVFEKEGDQIYLTYQTFARGLEIFNAAYGLMDLLPKGRDEKGQGMAWLRHRDAY